MTDPTHPAEINLRAAGDRIEHVLSELQAGLEQRWWAQVEEVLGLVTDLYAAGLEHLLALADEAVAAPEAAQAFFDRVAEDDLLASLLVLHGLHPDGLRQRVERALDHVRPYLASHGGDVELLDVDEEEASVRLRLVGSCDGCPSSSVTLSLAVEAAIAEAAPEVIRIDTGAEAERTANGTGPVPVQMGPTRGGRTDDWVTVHGLNRLPSGRVEGLDLQGEPLIACRVGDALVAYHDRCPTCESALRGGDLDGEVLRCPSCGAAFDVRLAGRSLDGTTTHLRPIPLLADQGEVRIAVAAAVGS